MLKAQLVRDLVFLVEPTIRTKVAWAGPERAGRKANSKSTCEVQALRTANALRERQPSVPFSAMKRFRLGIRAALLEVLPPPKFGSGHLI